MENIHYSISSALICLASFFLCLKLTLEDPSKIGIFFIIFCGLGFLFNLVVIILTLCGVFG